jgi:type I restriction enzyme M protein
LFYLLFLAIMARRTRTLSTSNDEGACVAPAAVQPRLELERTDPLENLSEAFRRLYFHLYSNSKASRAETIIEDLSLILLVKLQSESERTPAELSRFLDSDATADEVLIPLLRDGYPDLVDAERRFHIGDDAVREAFRQLEAINLSASPAHVLGDAFQAVIGPRLRGERGQFFTPRSVVRAMVEIAAPKAHESVLDPACGTGGFLLESHVFQASQGAAEGRLVGVDKDAGLARLSAALLRVATNSRSHVSNFSSLDLARWATDDRFDVILTNPPFGARIGITDRSVLKQYELAHRWVQTSSAEWRKTSDVLGSQSPQVLFLELCVRLLAPEGRLGIVLPEGLFGNRGDGYIWEWLAKYGRVDALLDCPRTTFQPGTDTKTNILFFVKSALGAKPPERSSVSIAVALNCGHDRRGRTHLPAGKPYPDDFGTIARSYHKPDEGGLWRQVQLSVGDYMVPRYYAEEKPLTAFEGHLTNAAEIVTLQDLVARGLIEVRKGHEVGSEAYGTGDVPFVRTSDVANFEISADPTKAVAEDIYAEYSPQQRLQPGDILLVVDGRYRIGATAMLTAANRRCVVQSHLRILTCCRPDRLDPYELLFALNLPSVRLRIRDLVFVQSTLGTLGKRLFQLRIPFLHGEGPWREHVDEFKRGLQERDRLLAQLRAFRGAEFEL